MAKDSKIEWTDHTVNLWWGCAKVHTGCKNCYAEYLSDTRYKKGLWGENAQRLRIQSAFSDLDKYQAQAQREGRMMKIFIGSMMDIFEESKELSNPIPAFFVENDMSKIRAAGGSRGLLAGFYHTGDLRNKLFYAISDGKYDNLIFLFLTKRPDLIASFAPASWMYECPPNVWFGTSISDQNTADIYGPKLAKWHGRAKVFLSIEPQVSEIKYIDPKRVDWVIQGGESGNRKRPFELAWAYRMRDICRESNLPYFFKQIDKVREIPEDLQIREFPIFTSK
jgi:protein gp37